MSQIAPNPNPKLNAWCPACQDWSVRGGHDECMFCDTPLVAEPQPGAPNSSSYQRPVDAEGWPYSFELLDVGELFVDDSYQRPLTSFVSRIARLFDPALFGSLVVSERRKGRFAVVDGQTRAAAVKQLALAGRATRRVPCLVYRGLTRSQEASLFARLQKERRGISSYHRFRAALVAGELEALAIQKIVTDAEYEIGDAPSQIGAVAALEKVYRRSPEILDLVLMIARNAWGPEYVPSGDLLRVLGYFFDNAEGDVDEDRLTERLSTVTPGELSRMASALREGHGHGGGSEVYMSQAIEHVYRGRLRAVA
jgi:hypothetical protein